MLTYLVTLLLCFLLFCNYLWWIECLRMRCYFWWTFEWFSSSLTTVSPTWNLSHWPTTIIPRACAPYSAYLLNQETNLQLFCLACILRSNFPLIVPLHEEILQTLDLFPSDHKFYIEKPSWKVETVHQGFWSLLRSHRLIIPWLLAPMDMLKFVY